MEPVMRSADTPRLGGGDTLRVEMSDHNFSFDRSVDRELAGRIINAINLMGGTGERAEACYQRALDGLARRSKEVNGALQDEYDRLPARHYLDRWSLVQLSAELKSEEAIAFHDRILSTAIPPENSEDPHSHSSVGEEVMIRTTAIEALSRIASDGSIRALELLLRHATHEIFSVKRAAIQAYLTHSGPDGRDKLLKVIPERDHHILDIRRTDVRQIPQAQGGLHLVCRDNRDLPTHDLGSDDKPAHGTKDDGCCNC